MAAEEKVESTLVSLELRPVPFPLIEWVWISAALAVVAVGLWVAALSNPGLGFWLIIIGLASLPLNPRLRRRIPRRLEVDANLIRFLRGDFIVKVLSWYRVEKVQYGRMRWRRMRRSYPVGSGNERVYISFIAIPDLQSIRVEGFDYELRPDDIERVIAAIGGPTKSHGIPVEEKEWLVFP
jgi:hypothetical protein